MTAVKDQLLAEHTDLVAHWKQLFTTSLFNTIQGAAGDRRRSQICAHTHLLQLILLNSGWDSCLWTSEEGQDVTGQDYGKHKKAQDTGSVLRKC